MATKDHDTLYGIPAKKAFTIENLPVQRAVQKAYVGTSNLYALQKYGDDLIISRAPITKFSGKAQTAYIADHMTLTGFGHGQTLDWFRHGTNDYFLVATKPNSAGWATQIGRIKYDSQNPVSGNTAITRLSSINRAQKSGHSIGTLLRAEAAVSTSGKEILILAMAQDLDGHNTKSVFTRYKLDELNGVLDDQEAAGTNFISAGDDKVTATAIDTMTVSGSLYSNTINGSIQGIDLSDGAAIYISSGNEGEQPAVSKSYWQKDISKGKTVDNYYWPISKGLVETEGIQVKDYLYLGVAYHSQPASVTYEQGNRVTDNLVYYIDKTKI